MILANPFLYELPWDPLYLKSRLSPSKFLSLRNVMQDLTNFLLLLRDFSMVQMAFMGVADPPTESKTFSLGFCFFMSITLSYLKSENLYNMLNKKKQLY